jgi:hypothetical protein
MSISRSEHSLATIKKAEPVDVALEIAGNFDRPVRSIP